MTNDEMIEAVKAAFRAEEKANWNLELGTDEDVSDLARAAIRVIAPAVLEEATEEASIAWDAVDAIRAMKTRYEQ